MYAASGLQFYPSQSVHEQNKLPSHIAKSDVATLQNAPIPNYAEDFQTRLEVVSKLRVPHNEVERAYSEFVKKLNDMCYETIAEQLVRSRPVSVAGSVRSVTSQNTRPPIRKIVKKSDNNSTIHRLYKAAEGVQKHLSTISESSHGDGLNLPTKQANGRNKSKILANHEKSPRNMDNTMDHFRSDNLFRNKPSRKIVSKKKLKEKGEESSAEIIETEFNITKDSLRSGNMVVREQKKNVTATRTKNFKHRQNEVDSRSVVLKTKKLGNEKAQESFHDLRLTHRKTALSPFYQRLHKQRRLSPKTTPQFKL